MLKDADARVKEMHQSGFSRPIPASSFLRGPTNLFEFSYDSSVSYNAEDIEVF